ncbi:MAG: hypothetical protein H0U74_11160 [Bradymonadaceae bacterium]|nr:hypothetical protein [Lujinxingiaceae bacterium]
MNKTRRIRKIWVLFNLSVLIVLVFGILPGALEALLTDREAELGQAIPDHSESQLRYMREHLQGSFDGYKIHQKLASQFDVIVLSHMASGMMNLATADPDRGEELGPLTAEIARRALMLAPYKSDPRDVKDLGQHNLYHSHLNLILGIHRHVSSSKEHDTLHRRLSRHLSAMSLADGDFHARSYASFASGKWPADQAVTLASLHLYDRIHRTSLSKAPIRGWLGEMAKRTDAAHGLHHSALFKTLWYAEIPRGCGLSWTILYMAQFAPGEAGELYERYRSAYGSDVLGFGGFREWPPGAKHGFDVDSGPIIFGIGMAATGLGLGPARMFGDGASYAAIMRSATVFGAPSRGLFGGRRYRLAPLVGEAMLFNGTTARLWFAQPTPSSRAGEKAPAPVGPAIITLIVVLASVLVARALYRELRRVTRV